MQPAIFEEHEIRRAYDEEAETWWFSVVEPDAAIVQQSVGQLPWGRNRMLLDRLNTPEERLK